MDTQSIYTPKYVYVQLQQVADMIHKSARTSWGLFWLKEVKDEPKGAGYDAFKNLVPFTVVLLMLVFGYIKLKACIN